MKLAAKLVSKICLLLVMIALLAMLEGCGKNKESTNGAVISVNPASITSSIATDTTYNFTVTVKYADGLPYPNAVLNIDGSFAEPRNTTNTLPRYQFYYFTGGATNLANVPVDSPFTAQTDDYGNYSFSITVPGLVTITTTTGTSTVVNSFKDNIDVHSGGAFASVSVAIN
jgi:hypothetical protein